MRERGWQRNTQKSDEPNAVQYVCSKWAYFTLLRIQLSTANEGHCTGYSRTIYDICYMIYEIRHIRYEIWYEIWDIRYDISDMRYGIRDMRYDIWDIYEIWYEI